MSFFAKITEKKRSEKYVKESEETRTTNSLEFNKILKPINEYNKKGNEQLERIIRETQLSKESKNYEDLIKVYEEILLKEGLCFDGRGYYINLAELYYKTGQVDKAWLYSNKIGMKHPLLMDKIREFQVQILKEEKKYTEALLFQLEALFYEIDKNYKPSAEKIEKKLNGLIKKCKLSGKSDAIKALIFNSISVLDLNNKFKELMRQ
ncbi:MAG: hypothetical protein ACOH15_07350 [Acetobacterium sp.]